MVVLRNLNFLANIDKIYEILMKPKIRILSLRNTSVNPGIEYRWNRPDSSAGIDIWRYLWIIMDLKDWGVRYLSLNLN